MTDDKDKLESLKFISQTHRALFDERRKIEWKIIFTYLSFYIGIITARYSGKLDETFKALHENIYFEIVIAIAFLFITIITIVYLGFIHIANNKNKYFAENAENTIVKIIANQSNDGAILNIFSPSTTHWISWKGVFTKMKKGEWSWICQCNLLLAIVIASLVSLFLN